ncbi:MAG: hypothetical protein A3J74_11665 [Elusimicrobia bacterium RIFCSPHIGHO2_02_FULL_57_9]|nr:MAG: hypothetical protein A3J74_11665 [Elusimicrobia bacterium RIFCSPHIGHO2_02_FULL_57_9]
MKIFQVGKFPRERPGGIETAVFSLAKQLALRHQVEVAVSATGGVGKTFSWEGVACHQLPTWFSIFSTPVSPSLIGALRRASGFDVLQISYQNPMAALAYWIARPAGRLVIWYHHDIVRQVWLGRLLEPLLSHLLKKADAIVSTSRAYAGSSIILRKFADKVRVIPLGIELSPFEDDKEIRTSEIVRRRYGSPLILFIGRLVYYKGLDYLIEAMQGLKANLLVIGSGPLESRLRAGAQTRGVGPQVHFLEVPFDEPLARYLHACDLLVLPSVERTEAFGLVLLEAMACGKPVITTEIGTGTSFVCSDGVTGLIIPPQDAPALRRALQKLLSNPVLARKMGEAGQNRVRQFFSAEVMAESFLELYRSLLGFHAQRV